MLRKFIYIILLATLLFANDIKDRTEEIIHNVYPGDVEFEMIKFDIPGNIKNEIEKKCRQKFFQDHLFIWKIRKGNEIKGYAVLDNVYGKSMPITFVVVFDEQFNILNSDVVKYREPYGGAVQSDEWNKQFKGKNAASGYNVGDEISGISGATISVHSLAKGIRKLALLMPKIKDLL